MIQAAFCLFSVAVVSGINYDGLRVKFGWSDALADMQYFFNIPRTIHEVEREGWTRTERSDGPMQELRMYCAPGRVVCPLYDTAGFIAGLQIAVKRESLTRTERFDERMQELRLYCAQSMVDVSLVRHDTAGFVTGLLISIADDFVDSDQKPGKAFTKWTPLAAEGEPARTYWTATQFFVSADSLKAGAGPTVENGAILQDGGVWVNGLDGKLMKIPLKEEDLKNTLFKKQNCIPNMGTHYYYNLTKDKDCESGFLPWFAMVTRGEVLGVGFQTPGRVPQTKHRQWFEDVPSDKRSASLAFPRAPDCFLDLYENYGILSIHIYYIDEPWRIKCESGDSIEPAPVMDRLALSGYRYANQIGDEFKKLMLG